MGHLKSCPILGILGGVCVMLFLGLGRGAGSCRESWWHHWRLKDESCAASAVKAEIGSLWETLDPFGLLGDSMNFTLAALQYPRARGWTSRDTDLYLVTFSSTKSSLPPPRCPLKAFPTDFHRKLGGI